MKPRWRRILNARFLRWWGLKTAVRIVPGLGRRLGFFPDHVGVIESADQVLADEFGEVSPDELRPHMDFLALCKPHDTAAASVDLPHGVITGRRTALYRNAWIDMSNSTVLLPDRQKSVLVRGERANWNAISIRPRQGHVPVSGRVFVPLATTNYFHVLLENGMRLLDLLDSGLVDDAPLTMATRPGGGSVETAMYRGIAALHPGLSIVEMPGEATLHPDEAVIHFPRNTYWEWPPIDRAQADRLAEAFAQVYGPPAAYPAGTLYLSRRGARLRQILNEDALEAALIQRGVHVFTANDSNHPEQIARFRAASTIVSVHGAGLTNLIFAKPGTRVIEIFPQNQIKSPYWWISRKLGLDYRPVIAGPGDYHQHFDVDVDAILSELGET